jgi:hypothetical protein
MDTEHKWLRLVDKCSDMDVRYDENMCYEAVNCSLRMDKRLMIFVVPQQQKPRELPVHFELNMMIELMSMPDGEAFPDQLQLPVVVFP